MRRVLIDGTEPRLQQDVAGLQALGVILCSDTHNSIALFKWIGRAENPAIELGVPAPSLLHQLVKIGTGGRWQWF
ncbi:hypothetical protein LBMAG46_24300 [Planctomycetia bacterium]|nr:hypothetical protein LBMAG46_24300 [Planctomycetia bacterium]